MCERKKHSKPYTREALLKKEIDLSIIVAMTEKRIIGNRGELPWKRLWSDMKRFKENTTEAGAMIMGHTTYVSILKEHNKPLPGRKHIVLTRNKFLSSQYASVKFVHSAEEALREVALGGGKAFVIGGGEIYKTFLLVPEVRTMLLTIVHTVQATELRGDTFFPEIGAEWNLISESPVRLWDPEDAFETSFKVYQR